MVVLTTNICRGHGNAPFSQFDPHDKMIRLGVNTVRPTASASPSLRIEVAVTVTRARVYRRNYHTLIETSAAWRAECERIDPASLERSDEIDGEQESIGNYVRGHNRFSIGERSDFD
jgi:hypothetical protein